MIQAKFNELYLPLNGILGIISLIIWYSFLLFQNLCLNIQTKTNKPNFAKMYLFKLSDSNLFINTNHNKLINNWLYPPILILALLQI